MRRCDSWRMGLPQALKPLLYPIGLHEGHVDAALTLAHMAKAAQQTFTPQAVQQALQLLEAAGLLGASATTSSGCIRRSRATCARAPRRLLEAKRKPGLGSGGL